MNLYTNHLKVGEYKDGIYFSNFLCHTYGRRLSNYTWWDVTDAEQIALATASGSKI